QVKNRLEIWNKANTNPQVRRQLEWESHVVEYVDFVYKETCVHGNKNSSTGLKLLSKGIPLLGPIMPRYSFKPNKRTPSKIEPKVHYLRPLNIIHPFYYDIGR
ncbi:hypothetical protein C8J57DRAFT_1065720, partial [Mycena rebaudengoi]